ncbi:MAG: radical SAM protein [Bacteroidota bacterium]
MLQQINKKLLPGNYFFAPNWIILGVNNACNLHCKMCDVGTKSNETIFAQNLMGTEPLNMPSELIRKVIDQTAQHFPKAKLGYAFTEPLIYPHLEESLQYAFKKNIKTAVTTNALTLKQNAAKLVSGNLGELYISLDGPQKIHNEIRGNQQSFQKAIEGIDEIYRLNPSLPISIFCVITEWNIGHLNEFARFFKDYPIQTMGFMHTNFTPQSVADHHNTLWGNAYKATSSNVDFTTINNYNLELLWEEIQQLKSLNCNFPVTFSPEIATKEKLVEFYKNPEIKIGKSCSNIFATIMIKSDGSVIPAHGRCYNLQIGNLYSDNLKEIWHSKVLARFRSDLMKNEGLLPACSRCCSAF